MCIYCEMITTGRLVNTPITHHLTTCVCVLKTFKIYSLSNLQEYNHSVISQNHHAMQHLPWLTHLIFGILCLSNTWTRSPPPTLPPPTHNHHSTLSVSSFFFFLDSTYKWDHLTFVFLWFISLSLTPTRFIHVTNGRISFFVAKNIPVYMYATFSLSVHPSGDM